MDVDLTNDDPMYPNLMVDLEGDPVDGYSNGGNLQEVRPEFGDAGIFEINHFYSNTASPSVTGTTATYRLPIATDQALLGGKVDVTVPGGLADITFDGVSTTARMSQWGTPYSDYAWGASAPLTATDNGDGKWTVTLPDLPADTGVVFQLTGTVPTGTDLTSPLVASAQLTGSYIEGSAPGCQVGLPPIPEAPVEDQCEQVLIGRTVRPVDAPDVTVRDKSGDGGETNADSFGPGARPTFRLYGATEKDLTGVSFVVKAAQGLTFTSVGDVSSPALGALQGNGFTGAATGVGEPVLSSDGKTITLSIASMPAQSSFSFNASAVSDGSGKALVLDETMIGDLTGCTPTSPTPTPTETPAPTKTPTPSNSPTPSAPPTFAGTASPGATPSAPAPTAGGEPPVAGPGSLAATGVGNGVGLALLASLGFLAGGLLLLSKGRRSNSGSAM